MPHIQIQATLQDPDRVGALAKSLHQAAVSCGHFPEGGVRTFALNPSFGFCGPEEWNAHYVQVFVRILPGRAPDLTNEILETLFTAMRGVVEGWKAQGLHVGYQMELSEFDKTRVKSGGVLDAPSGVTVTNVIGAALKL